MYVFPITKFLRKQQSARSVREAGAQAPLILERKIQAKPANTKVELARAQFEQEEQMRKH